MSLIAYGLVVKQNTILYDIPSSTFYTLIIVANGSQRPYLSFIRKNVYQVITIVEFFGFPFIQSKEACSGKIGFIPKYTIQLGWMSCRLMNRQPQMRRIQD